MECNERTATTLFEYCEKLLSYSEITNGCSFTDDDHVGFMSLCFISKQFDHLSAITRLYPHTDIQLISRTMVEGLLQLSWCHTHPENARKWRMFAWVSDWRLIRRKQLSGDDYSESYLNEIEKNLSEVGHLFLKSSAKNHSDPYHVNWRCGVSLKDISNELGGEKLYSLLYSDYSDWQHWGSTSMGSMIYRQPATAGYAQSLTKGQICSSLAVAFLCAYQMLEIINDHFLLGLTAELEELKNEYITANKHTPKS